MKLLPIIALIIMAIIPIVSAPIWYGTGDNTGLVGHWRCEGNFLDSSGNGYNGTQYNGVKITSGVKGRACGFDGSDDEIRATPQEIAGNITIAAWFKLAGNGNSATSRIVDRTNNGMGYSIGITNTTNYPTFIIGNGTAYHNLFANNTADLGEWNHLTGVFDNNTKIMQIYINGQLSNTYTLPGGSLTSTSGMTFRIGTRAATQYFNGTIDEVRIYNRSLSATEISALYDTGKTTHIEMWSTPALGGLNETPAPTLTDETGLVGWWKMDDYTNGNTTDSSGQDNDGVINGATFSNGRWNSAYNFSSTNNISMGNIFNPEYNQSFSVSFWSYRTNNSGTDRLVSKKRTGSAATDAGFNIQHSTVQYPVLIIANGTHRSYYAYGGTAPTNTWVHYVGVINRESGVFQLYKDGSLMGSGSGSETNMALITNLSNSFDFLIGAGLPGSIDEVRIYNRSLSADEIKELYLSKGLVGYWKMDADQRNTTDTYDNSGYYNYGKITGAVLTNEGKFKEGYKFDGNDVITAGTVFTNNGNFTVSAWIYPMEEGGDSSGSSGIVSKASSSIIRRFWLDYEFDTNSTALIMGNGSTNTCYAATGANTVLSNRWTLITGTYNMTGGCHLFINGILTNSDTDPGNIPTNPQGLTANTLIGNDGGSTTRYFNGTIDEVRIYDKALSPSEIAQLYNGTKSNYISLFTIPALGGLNDTPEPALNDGSGLVGWWKMDDLTNGNTTDSSGQGNNGSVIGATFSSDGRWDEGYDFDGINDYIQLISNPINNTNFTLSMWFNIRDVNAYDMLYSGADNVDVQLFFYSSSKHLTTSVENSEKDTGFNISQHYNEWVHVGWTHLNTLTTVYINGVMVLNTTDTTAVINPADTIRIGNVNSGSSYYINGTIDEVRIYNRSLSADEVKELYLSKGLVGYWKMDADQRNTTDTYDSSGYNNYGKINGAVLTNEGRFKEGYKFDGVNDYLNISNSSSLALPNITVSAWIYPKSIGTYTDIMYKYDGVTMLVDYWFLMASSGELRFYTGGAGDVNAARSSTAISLNKWQFITGVYNGTDTLVYIDGVYNAKAVTPLAPDISRANLLVGYGYASASRYFNGTIDEVRVYNRALTSTEIGQLYNGTKSNRIQLWSIPG